MTHRMNWPSCWQPEAIDAVLPYVNSEYLVEIWVGDPATSIDGSLLAGHLFTDESGELKVIHDRSGRPDVFSWSLLGGPVLRATARLPGKRRTILYTHPTWVPPKRT